MSVAKIKAAVDGSGETYVEVKAGVLDSAIRELGPNAKKLGLLSTLAARVASVDPDRRMLIHRDAHAGQLLGLATPAATEVQAPAPTPIAT